MTVFTQADLLASAPSGRMAQPVRLRVGDQIGDLRVIGDEPPEGRHRILRFCCECGAEVIRRAGAVLTAMRNGVTPMCFACRGRLRCLAKELSADARRLALRKRWFDTGSLYSDSETARMAEDVRLALEAEIAPVRDDDAERVRTRGLWVEPTWRDRRRERRASESEVSMDAGLEFWRCVENNHRQRLEQHELLSRFVSGVSA